MNTIQSIDIKNKRVLVRADFNVLDKHGRVQSDFRVKVVIPTIKHLKKNKCQIIIASHAGRPNGQVKPELSLHPIAKRLAKLTRSEVIMAIDCIGKEVQELVAKTSKNKIILLENLRFHKEEELNDSKFAEQLALLADVYINDAFSVCHRENASVCAITKYLPSVAGFQLQKEIQALSVIKNSPKHPFLVIIGGAKAKDKLAVITFLTNKVNRVLVGGAVANTFLKSEGINVGNSLIDDSVLGIAKDIMLKNVSKIVLPVDAIVVEVNQCGYNKNAIRKIKIDDVTNNEAIVDIGKKTVDIFATEIKKAGMIFWAGPLGNTYEKEFAKNTLTIAKIIARSKKYTVIGGGETAIVFEKLKLLNKVAHVSTGGGSALEFLAGKNLPGLIVL